MSQNIVLISRPNGKSDWRSLIYCSITFFTKDNKIEVKSHTYDHWTDVNKFIKIYEDETIPRMSEYSIIKLYNKHKNWEYVYYDIIRIQRDKKIDSILH